MAHDLLALDVSVEPAAGRRSGNDLGSAGRPPSQAGRL
jgi:hypothetical protein